MNTMEVVRLIEGMIQGNDKPPFSLGRIDPNYSGGKPRILFDGERSVSKKRYPYLSSYKPKSNDRVLMANMANTHVVIGHIGSYRTPDSDRDVGTNIISPKLAVNAGNSYPLGISIFSVFDGLSRGFPADEIMVKTINTDFMSVQQVVDTGGEDIKVWMRKYNDEGWSNFKEMAGVGVV